MAEVKAGTNQLFLREEELRKSIELLFFAYRDFTGEADSVLQHLNFGRAHHRVIYFVGCRPGMPVSDLLAILKITKQSLSRVLSQLLDEGYIIQKEGLRDRRQRLLELTPKGIELEQLLTERQRRRVARAFREAGPQAVEGFRTVLLNMIDDPDRARFVEDPKVRAAQRRGVP